MRKLSFESVLKFFLSALFTLTLLITYGASGSPASGSGTTDEQENIHRYDLVIGYTDSKDPSKPIGMYLKDDPEATGPKFPGPTLYFEEGETAVIRVYNQIPEETSIHWHGIILPNAQDGVPYITTKPIPPYNSKGKNQYFEYKFKIQQNGTYWYHSHSAHQEQRGMFGPIVIFPAESGEMDHSHHEMPAYDQVIDYSDYVKRNPEDVLTVLKTDNEREVRTKGTERPLSQDLKEKTLWKRFKCETNNMGPMDIADVAIDSILANGKLIESIHTVSGNSELVKLRLINSSASSFVQVTYGKGRKMKIIASDGLDVTPHETDYLLMGVGETYDILVYSDPQKNIELRSTVFELNAHKYASTFIGPEEGDKEFAPHMSRLNPCDHQSGNLVYNKIKSLKSVHDRWKWPAKAPIKEFNLTLTGDMRANRYVWSMNNGKVFGDTEPLIIKKGDHVKVNLVNNTMMFHPIHLHGHFFSITSTGSGHHGGHEGGSNNEPGGHSGGDHNGGNDHGGHNGDAAPVLWKHTMIMAPHSQQVLEFYANDDRNWLFHCHNMYHMVTGMSVMFSYITDNGSNNGAQNGSGHDHHSRPDDSSPTGSYPNNTLKDARTMIKSHDEMSGKQGGYTNFDVNVLSNQTEGQVRMNLNDKTSATFQGKYGYEEGHHRERLDLTYYPKQDSYTGLYGAVEDSTGAKGVYGAAGLAFKVFSLEGQLGWGTKGIDACVARDVPLVGQVYFYGRYCRQGQTNYYDARVGYHLNSGEGNQKVNIDPTCGVNEDGVHCGVNIHGGVQVKKPTLFENIMPKK